MPRKNKEPKKPVFPTLRGHPIHKKVLKQLREEKLIVEYRCRSTNSHVFGLKPSARRELLGLREPSGFQDGQTMTPTKLPHRWARTAPDGRPLPHGANRVINIKEVEK